MTVRNILFRIMAVLLGLAVALGLAETAVRFLRPQEIGPPRFAFHPELGEIPVPGQKARRHYPGVYDFTYSNNSLGFRGRREYGPRQPGGLRVLLLGDSFVYGLGVNDEQTFAVRLEQILRQHHPAVEVINAGCPGKGTDYALKLFQTLGVKLQPDLTVLCFFANDFQDNGRGEYFQISADGGLRVKPLEGGRGGLKSFLYHFPGYSWLISWSHAANLAKAAAVGYLAARKNEAGDSSPGAASGLVVSYSYDGLRFSDPANIQVTEIYLTQLRKAVQQAGGEFVCGYIPFGPEVQAYRRSRKASPDEQALQSILENQGERCYSLIPVLAAAPGRLSDLYLAEGHWTPQAHLLVASHWGSCLTPYIEKRRPRPEDN